MSFLSPRGARFECYESAVRFAATSNPSLSFDPAKTSLDGDASTVTLPDLTLTTASYFDDWLHRGTDNVLSSLPWYVLQHVGVQDRKDVSTRCASWVVRGR